MRRLFVTTVSQSGVRLCASVDRAGDDLVIVVTGGDRPHVGVLAVAQPHPSSADAERPSATVSTLAIPPHREGQLAGRIADVVCRHTGVVTVVTAGIHIDAARPADITLVEGLAERLAARLCALIDGQPSRSRR